MRLPLTLDTIYHNNHNQYYVPNTYRIGQDKNVLVHRMITLGTFEEKIDEMLKSKKELADLAVYEGEKIITELSDDEIYEIFTLSA